MTQPSIYLLNVTNQEKHHIQGPECIIGRGWLNCNDKRISKTHGVLKIKSHTSVNVLSTHTNPIFYKKKSVGTLSFLENRTEIELSIGDLFGLLPDSFWFRIEPLDSISTNPAQESNSLNVENATTSSDSSSTVIVKTERFSDDESTTEFDGPPNCPAAITIKTEQNINSNANDIANIVKTEIKQESSGGNENDLGQKASTSTNSETNQRTQSRTCCKYGIRCYRRNPIHRIEEAHPGDPDYTMPDYGEPPYGVPSCPYAERCYRRNPLHFKQYAHPDLKKRNPTTNNSNDKKNHPSKRKRPNTYAESNEDNDDEEDPYATDEDSDFQLEEDED